MCLSLHFFSVSDDSPTSEDSVNGVMVLPHRRGTQGPQGLLYRASGG